MVLQLTMRHVPVVYRVAQKLQVWYVMLPHQPVLETTKQVIAEVLPLLLKTCQIV